MFHIADEKSNQEQEFLLLFSKRISNQIYIHFSIVRLLSYENKWTTEAVQKCCLNDPKGLGGKCAYLLLEIAQLDYSKDERENGGKYEKQKDSR